MEKNNLKGGKADKLSVADIAKKNNVSIEQIESQIEMGKKIEMEHVNDVKLAEEIAMDHLEEIPDYYTRLNKMEKQAKKELTNESKRFMALAGIKEGDKKFITNESFQEKAQVDEGEDEDNFIIHEFEQTQVEPGEDDDLYKILSQMRNERRLMILDQLEQIQLYKSIQNITTIEFYNNKIQELKQKELLYHR
jgi:hypothetical protein